MYDCLTRLNRTTERRLLIDLWMLRERYERHEISEVFWILSRPNSVDSFTKLAPSMAFS